MPTRLLVALATVLIVPVSARAAVVVIANYTAEAITFTVAEPDAKPRARQLAANHVEPVFVTGPADISFRAKGRDTTLRLDAYHAYVFLPDRAAGVRLEGVELPGEMLERDRRAELNPVPRDPPVKVPVTLLVDDADPRAEKLWQKELRARFDEVAAVVEKSAGIRLEVAGFDSWNSDPTAKTTAELLAGLEKAVAVKPGALAVGYTSRPIDEKTDPALGAARGLAGRHVLVREWVIKSAAERAEVTLHFVAQALGAVGSPDPASAMRAKLGNGYLLHAESVMRLDPLNALALNLWADERRTTPAVELATLSPINRHRLARVYEALRKASPDDQFARVYLDELGRVPERRPEPAAPEPDRPHSDTAKRDELARKIVRAVVECAKRNAAPGAEALTGDELTALYVRAAAVVALANPGPEMVGAFLVALGVALDDSDPPAGAATRLESATERKERLAVLGNPTLAGRRDLCRRFFIGAATREFMAPGAAEKSAVGRVAADLRGPSGFCAPVLAAEFAGIAFARTAHGDPEVLRDVLKRFRAAEYLPPVTGLRNGLSAEKFAERFGATDDARFVELLADIRNRIGAMTAYR